MMLALQADQTDNCLAADTDAAWFGDQNDIGGQTAARRYFYVRSYASPLGGMVGIPSGMPVSYVTGSPTLLMPPTFRLATEERFKTDIGEPPHG